MVKISVIVPVYQVEKYLEKCLQTIISQSFSDFEVICVNDGSQDDSVKILNKFAHYHHVKIIHQENGGLSKARNAGIKVAQGDYLTFVDSDDWLAVDYLEKLYEATQQTHYKIIKCNICAVYLQHQSIFYQLPTGDYDLKQLFPFQPSAWSALYHRSLWQNLKYPDNLLFEDLATWPLLLQQSRGIYYINEPLYYYNCTNETSIMNNPNQKHLVMDQVFNYILQYTDRTDVEIEKLIKFLYVRHVLIYHLDVVKYFPQSIRKNYLDKIYHYTHDNFQDYLTVANEQALGLHRKKDRLALQYFLKTKGCSYRLKWLYENKIGR